MVRWLASAALVMALAAAVGWPTLRRDYQVEIAADGRLVQVGLSGDDEQLIFNHVLVNRPSWEHASKLFEIVHRDLYQPIPLLTFQVEFALHGPAQNASEMAALRQRLHRTNVLIHALNGVLVLLLMGRWLRQPWPAVCIACLFVVHPLATECYAWLNGRMIMLSTLFSLGALIALDAWRSGFVADPGRWDRRPAGWLLAAATLGLVVLAMASKIRLGLPILMLIVALRPATGPPPFALLRRSVTWWACVATTAVLTIGFLAINVSATGDSMMFEGARNQLRGPNAARVVQALAWYLAHYVWPVGLAPWYAAPPAVSWLDPAVLRGLAIVVGAVVAAGWAWRRHPVVLWGGVWFVVTVAATLPIVPARNLLVADRYVYLSNIGLHAIVVLIATRFILDHPRWRAPLILIIVVVVAACIPASRAVTAHYSSDEAKIRRMVDLAPDCPTLLTSWGWYQYERRDYTGAIARADQELERFPDDDIAIYRALNLRAMSRLERDGDTAGAAADLIRAVDHGPQFAKTHYRLGLVYCAAGQLDAAEIRLRRAIELAPQFNPAIKRLARLCRERQKLDESRALYEQALENSAGYDIQAHQALAELDLESGQFGSAVARYEQLLSWAPARSDARVNLAYGLVQLGRGSEALAQYRIVLQQDAGFVDARLNMALQLQRDQRHDEAMVEFLEVLQSQPTQRVALRAATTVLRQQRRFGVALELLNRAVAADPQAEDLVALQALHAWFAGDGTLAGVAPARGAATPVVHLVRTLVAMPASKDLTASPEWTHMVQDLVSSTRSAEALEYAYEALEFGAVLDPQSPWPYYVTALLLAGEGRAAHAEVVRRRFEELCADPTARAALRGALSAPHTAP